MSGAIQLRDCETVTIEDLNTAADCIQAAANPEIVDAFEELVAFWCKDIEQVGLKQAKLFALLMKNLDLRMCMVFEEEEKKGVLGWRA